MSEENEDTQQTQETGASKGTRPQETQGTLEAALAEKDQRIAELEAQLGEARQAAESLRVLQEKDAAISEARDKAISKYLEAARALNPTIPKDVIHGQTVEEIDASAEKAKAIADAVKASLEAEAREVRVPAGAPARGGISLEGLSAREKIAAGLTQKGTM
jgi:hypothetical protein